MRFLAVSTPMTFTSTFWPGAKWRLTVPGGTPDSEFGIRPVRPGSGRTNTPKSGTRSNSPDATEPSGWRSWMPSHGFDVATSRSESDSRCCFASTSFTQPCTVWQRRDVNEAVHARLDLDEEAEIRVAGDGARERCAGSEALRQSLPGIGLELLHGKRNALALAGQLRHLDRDLLADGENVLRVRDPAPRDLRDVYEPVHAAEVDERSEIGEGADAAGQNRAHSDLLARDRGLLVLLDPEERGARDDHAAPVLGVLEDAEVVRLPHVGRERGLLVTAEVDLRDRAEGTEAVGASDHHLERALVPRP